MEYNWWSLKNNYWSASSSNQEQVPMSACNVACYHCGGNHTSSMCFNMPYSTHYGYEEYYQPPSQVNDNVNTDELLAQMSALTAQVTALTSSNCFNANQFLCCEICSGPHSTFECMYRQPSFSFNEEQVNSVSNFQRGNQEPYYNTFQSASPPQQPSQMEEFMMAYLKKTETYLQNQQVILDNLECQMSQLSQQLSQRPLESLPSNTEEEELHVREELENLEKPEDGRVESVLERNHVDEIPHEDVVLDECDLVDILEAIDPFDDNEKLEEVLALVSSSHDQDSLHEKDVEEEIQILEEKNGEVDSNMEVHDYEPSPIVEEMGRGEHQLVCLEIPKFSVEFDVAPIIEPLGYIVEFVKAPIQDLPGYVIEFAEELDFDSELHGKGIPGKIRGVEIQIELLLFRRELPQMAVKLWEWDTFPWDPGGYN